MKDVRKAAPSAKDINEAHRLARQSAESAVAHAIRCGQMLIARKDAGEHGDFEGWVSKHCDFAASTARKYMKAARQNATGVAFSSLQSLFPSGTYEKSKTSKEPSVPNTSAAPSPKSGEALPAAGQTVSADESTPAPGAKLNESKREASAPQSPEVNRAGVTIESAGESHVDSAQPGASLVDSSPRQTFTDGHLNAIDDEHESAMDEPERPDMEELDRQAAESYQREIQASTDKWLQSDDKLAAAQKEIERQAAEIVALKTSRNGEMNKASEAIKLVKQRDRTIARLERDLEKARGELEKLRERIAVMEVA